jgi:hypothetical protein
VVCSSHLPVVEAQEPAQALPADDRSGPRVIGWRLNESPIEALVVALGVVMGDVFSDGCAEMVLATLSLDMTDSPLTGGCQCGAVRYESRGRGRAPRSRRVRPRAAA